MTGGPLRIVTGINRPAAPASGSTVLARDLYSAMPGVRTTFLGRSPVDPSWAAAFDQLITLSTPKRPQGPDYGRYVAELACEVGAILQEVRPGAVHVHHPGFALSLALARTAGAAPLIAIAHGPEVMTAERSGAERDALAEVAAASTAIVAPAPALAERLDRLTAGRFTDRLTVIPWGIALGEARIRERPAAGPGPLSLVHAGRLDENKSTVTAIEALALTDQPHRLTVIGDGDLREHLEQRAAELGLGERVRIHPFLPRPQLWQLLPRFDAYVFTTTGTEAFGLILIEAQAHGLPVAYSNLPGVCEILGGAGIPYPPGDPRALAAVLDALGRDPHRRENLGKAAAANAGRYDIAVTGRRLRDLTLRAAS